MKITNDNPLILVDDDSVDLRFLARCLKDSQLTNPLLYFSTGTALLEHMQQVRSGAEPLPALILLDINMTGMDGFEVAERLRMLEGCQDLPVIVFYSNSDNPRDIARAKSLNAGFREKFSSRGEAVGFLNSLA